MVLFQGIQDHGCGYLHSDEDQRFWAAVKANTVPWISYLLSSCEMFQRFPAG